MPKKSLYIPDDIDANIIAASESESYSARVAYMCGVAHKVALEAAPALSVGEWCSIADALNGHYPSYEQGVNAVLGSAWHSVFDSAPECDEKWGVDCASLARRLLDLPLAAQAGVYEIARAFWRRGDEGSEGATYADVFTALGAKVHAPLGKLDIGATDAEVAAIQAGADELRGSADLTPGHKPRPIRHHGSASRFRRH